MTSEFSLFDPAAGEPEIVVSGMCAPADNMRLDEERARECAAGRAAPMVRLYGWQPWAVSLGANQREGDIDRALCAERGYDVVRRPTGGRAVLHANELTYCVVVPLGERRTVHDVYRDIHLLVRDAAVALGAQDVEFQKSQPDFRSHYKAPVRSLPCFSSAARYELQWRGKKFVGSAQRLFGTVVLQHGSILLGPGHEHLADVAALQSGEERRRMKDALLTGTATLSEICSRTVSFGECADAFVRQVRTALVRRDAQEAL